MTEKQARSAIRRAGYTATAPYINILDCLIEAIENKNPRMTEQDAEQLAEQLADQIAE